MKEKSNGWMIGFFIVLALLIISFATSWNKSSQIVSLKNQLNTSQTTLNNLTSYNATQQQTCIGDAEHSASVDPFYSSSLVQERITACQDQYPTN